MTHSSAMRLWSEGSARPSAPLRQSSALRHVEHLATLGLTPHIAIPEMLRVLIASTPGTAAEFCWIGGDGAVDDVRCVADGEIGLRASVDPADSQLRCTITAGGKVVATLVVWRTEPLRQRDRGLFQAALPSLRRAMIQSSVGVEQFEDRAEQTGVLIVTADYRLVSADERALRLLAEMEERAFAGTQARSIAPGDPLPSLITDIKHPLRTRGPDTAVLYKTSRWGAYRAQLFPQPPIGAQPPHQVVVVSKHLPRRLGLMRVLASLDLSPRERQTAFHLGVGADAQQSALAMGLSVATWRSYVKRVYLRLGVSDRFELVALLNRAGRSA